MPLFRKNSRKSREIDPDEIFLDSKNLPEFDTHQFEGRLERPLSKTSIRIVGLFFACIASFFFAQTAYLQFVKGETFLRIAENNSLRHTLVWSERGIITDRNGKELAWNVPSPEADDFSARVYADAPGIAHVVGYVSPPAKDASGFFYQDYFSGKDGVERFYDDALNGTHGLKIVETDALGAVVSEGSAEEPRHGRDLSLTIDARVEGELYRLIHDLASRAGFRGGSGVILNVSDGSILALVSSPEYDSGVLTDGDAADVIRRFVENPNKPFLNRAVSGVYAPGSIMKPFVALGALTENIISPDTKILSTGSISVPNPYNPAEKSVFKDWKAHGWVDMRDALAVSSDVYFYEVGGGYENQRGLGISNIEKYVRMFGFGMETGIDLPGEQEGTIPTPSWKESVFGDAWRLGDTYNTAIGQYGFQITPVQAARAAAALGNGGVLLPPHVVSGGKYDASDTERIKIPAEHFAVVKEGLRAAVLRGTAQALAVPFVSVAAKTGTAEIGVSKKRVNSWVIGFFPYEEPRFAFALVMESGPRENLVGAPAVMRGLLEWMSVNTPEYF